MATSPSIVTLRTGKGLKTVKDITRTVELPIWTEPGDLAGAKDAIIALGRSMHEHSFILGKTLAWVKVRVGHGNFAEWVQSNVWFSDRTAQRVIAFAAACDDAGRLLEYHPNKSDTVTDLALPEPELLDGNLMKLSQAYDLLDQWESGFKETLSASQQEGETLQAEIAELRALDLDAVTDIGELKKLIDRASLAENRAFQFKIRAARELGKILLSFPEGQREDFIALVNLPPTDRRRLVAERVVELLH